MSFELGSVIGDYEIIQILGAGGMGKVYKVRNVISDRIEAMKVLLPNLAADHELADRFMREIKVQAKLDHPNIAALHTAQRVDNQLLMIMEFVEGQPIDSLMKSTKIGLREGVDYVSQVLSALSFAHAHGVVHRDIKPANMMLTPEGVVKLMDFGIAKLAADRTLTQTGRTVGSLYYMSPEQIQGSTDLGPRSDLYSLGVSLYEMVTGARPFQGDSDFSIMSAHLQQTPVAPVQYDHTLPPALNEVILMSIAKDPDHRFQTADAFRNALLSVSKDLPMISARENDSATVVVPRMLVPPVVPDASPTRVSAAISVPTPPPAARPAPLTSPMPVAAAQAPVPSPPPQYVAPTPPPPVYGQQLPAEPAKSSKRGLYMVVGSLATLAVIGGAVLELPKLLKTEANTPAAVAAPQPAAGTTTNTPSPAQGTQQPAKNLELAQSKPAASETAPLVGASPQTKPAGPTERPRRDPPSVVAQNFPPAQQSPSAAPPQAAPTIQPQVAPPAPSGPDPATLKELDDLRERQSLMSVRMQTVLGSLKRLSAQQASSGLGPSPEMTSSANRMQLQMDQAASHIRAADPTGAKKSLDAAERELEKLEDRFGR